MEKNAASYAKSDGGAIAQGVELTISNSPFTHFTSYDVACVSSQLCVNVSPCASCTSSRRQPASTTVSEITVVWDALSDEIARIVYSCDACSSETTPAMSPDSARLSPAGKAGSVAKEVTIPVN